MMPNHHSLKKPWATRRRLLIGMALAACLITVVVFISRVPSRESLARRIAAMDARHALPAEKNAATIYDQVAASYVPAKNPADPNLSPAAVAALVEASKMDACWFPLSPGRQSEIDHYQKCLPSMREWARRLTSAAAKDIGDSRIDAAAEKLHCVVRMGRHLRQQLPATDFVTGIEIEASAWGTLCESVMLPDAPEELLRTAEAMAGDLDNDFEQAYAPVAEALPVFEKFFLAQQTILHQIEGWWWSTHRTPRLVEERAKETHLHLLCRRRGTRILVGLRRYHDANGRWPDSLDEIKTLVPEQALIDSFTEQKFVYRKEANQFVLYSTGPNGRDDHGLRGGKADDYRIWPRYGITAPQKETPRQKEKAGGLERNP